MTDAELQALTEHISLESFGKPFKHEALFNGRLKTTGGRYHLEDHHIDINPKMLTEHDMATLVGVIKHELVHYHLHLAGFSGKHNTRAFKQMLRAVGGSRYAPAAKPRPRAKQMVVYQCVNCGQTYHRQRKMNTSKYVCGKCRGHLKLVSIQKAS